MLAGFRYIISCLLMLGNLHTVEVPFQKLEILPILDGEGEGPYL